jgi:hypothetical protein
MTAKATRTHVWSYHYLDHMQTEHPTQLLTAADVEKWSLAPAEFKGVLGKEMKASLLDAGVKQHLNQLKREAGLVEPNPQSQPSLFWSRVLHSE